MSILVALELLRLQIQVSPQPSSRVRPNPRLRHPSTSPLREHGSVLPKRATTAHRKLRPPSMSRLSFPISLFARLVVALISCTAAFTLRSVVDTHCIGAAKRAAPASRAGPAPNATNPLPSHGYNSIIFMDVKQVGRRNRKPGRGPIAPQGRKTVAPHASAGAARRPARGESPGRGERVLSPRPGLRGCAAAPGPRPRGRGYLLRPLRGHAHDHGEIPSNGECGMRNEQQRPRRDPSNAECGRRYAERTANDHGEIPRLVPARRASLGMTFCRGAPRPTGFSARRDSHRPEACLGIWHWALDICTARFFVGLTASSE